MQEKRLKNVPACYAGMTNARYFHKYFAISKKSTNFVPILKIRHLPSAAETRAGLLERWSS